MLRGELADTLGYTRKQGTPEQVELYRLAVKDAPDVEPLRWEYGKVLQSAKQDVAAAAQYGLALGLLRKEEYELRFKLADIYKTHGQYAAAARECAVMLDSRDGSVRTRARIFLRNIAVYRSAAPLPTGAGRNAIPVY